MKQLLRLTILTLLLAALSAMLLAGCQGLEAPVGEPQAVEAGTTEAGAVEVDMVGEGWAPASFAPGAFPNPFPVDGRHEDAWFNEQCQTCHEQQIQGAPEIPHDVWTQNCRSCHVPDTQAEVAPVADWAPAAFASGAFPSPFPVDSRHEDAWFNEQCQQCHEQELDGATAIPHDIWTQNCRACHVPAEQDVGQVAATE